MTTKNDETGTTTPPDNWAELLADLEADRDKWKALSRKHETRAGENAGAAAELAALKDSGKSADDKMADRIAALEADLAESKTAAAQSATETLRFKVAAKHGIEGDDVELFLTGTDEATLTKQASRLAEQNTANRKSREVVGNEGKPPAGGGDDELRQFTAQLFGRST